MTYPQQPYGQLPPQGYPVQQPGYAQPQAAPQQPGYSQQPGYPAPGTAYTPPPPQQYPPYPPQGQNPYPQQGQPPQEPVHGTLQDFMNQPSTGGGPSLSFPHPGTRYVGTVIRNVTDADIQPQTDMITGAVATYNDRRPKLVMKVPLLLHVPSPAYPEGIGVWYVKGNDRAELARAMEAAGAEPGAPQAGDVIEIVYTNDQPGRRGMNPTKIKRVSYAKGNGTPPQLPQQQQAQPQQPAPGYAPQGQGLPQYQLPQQEIPPAQFTGTDIFPNQQQAPAYQQPYGGPGPSAMVQGPGGGLVPTGPGGVPQQPAPGAQPGPYGQPQADWNPYAQQPAPPTAQPAAAPAPAPQTATATGPASPSNAPVPGGPPADWPADVPFIPGLTADMARIAMRLGHPAASGQ